MSRHVRVNGWCQRCGGLGLASVEHVDATIVDQDPEGVQAIWDVGELGAVWAAALTVVAEAVRTSVSVRLVGLAGSRGCEAGAARAFQEGRLQVVDSDMWEALGLPAPGRGGGL